MEKLKNLGTDIASIIGPTIGTYVPLLQANAKAIKSTQRETHSYGSHPRQELDVYKPESNLETAPIVVWVHGGGFNRGAKNLEGPPDDLVYANVGHFFASRGYIAIFINYRLVGSHDAKFPSGGEDVATAVEWIIENYGNTPRDLFLLGNSAGGAHLATFVFYPEFKETLEKITQSGGGGGGGVRLKGVGFIAVPYIFLAPPEYRLEVLRGYYGDSFKEQCVYGLLDSSSDETWSILERAGVRFNLVTFELDPADEILEPRAEFEKLWRQKRGEAKELTTFHAPGHNHISHFAALGTGIESEEAWGVNLVKWFEASRQ